MIDKKMAILFGKALKQLNHLVYIFLNFEKSLEGDEVASFIIDGISNSIHLKEILLSFRDCKLSEETGINLGMLFHKLCNIE